MKAITLKLPSSLTLQDLPTPTPPPDSLLIRIHACAITRHELTWSETIARTDPIPCHDIAGTVVSAGTDVPASCPFKEGDSVFALVSFSRDGGAAEYAIALPEELAPMPSNLTWTQAASIPLSALSAWQALVEHAGISSSSNNPKTLLVTGGAGGVGVMAIQLAVALGMHVTASGSKMSRKIIEECGAHVFLDYRNSEWWKNSEHQNWDVILDTVGGETLRDCLDLVASGGSLVAVSEPIPQVLDSDKRPFDSKFFIVKPSGSQLEQVLKLVEANRVKPFVDSIFPLEETTAAFAKVETGKCKGKVVLDLGCSRE